MKKSKDADVEFVAIDEDDSADVPVLLPWKAPVVGSLESIVSLFETESDPELAKKFIDWAIRSQTYDQRYDESDAEFARRIKVMEQLKKHGTIKYCEQCQKIESFTPKESCWLLTITFPEVSNWCRCKKEESHNDMFQEKQKRIEELEREIEVLRLYGNKDCTAMADEVLKGEREHGK
jgi:hypothetical protein